jgi:hypothetical protein
MTPDQRRRRQREIFGLRARGGALSLEDAIAMKERDRQRVAAQEAFLRQRGIPTSVDRERILAGQAHEQPSCWTDDWRYMPRAQKAPAEQQSKPATPNSLEV